MTDLITDPFTQIYNAIWTVLENHDGITSRVRLKNRIKFSGKDPDPQKSNVMDADLPELTLTPSGGGGFFWTSTGIQMEPSFKLQLATGDLRVQKQLFPIKWEIIRALKQTRTNLDLSFVKNIEISDIDESTENADSDRGTPQWTGLFEILVHVYLTDTELQTD